MVMNAIKEITLEGTFYEMGRQYGEQLKDDILDQMMLYQQHILPSQQHQQEQYQAAESKFLAGVQANCPIEIKDFLNGILDGLHAKGIYHVTIDDLFRLDQLYLLSKLTRQIQNPQGAQVDEQTTHCSVIAMKKDGAVGVGRNFDWTKEIVKPFTDHPLVVHLKCTEKGHTTPITGIGYVGMVSLATIITRHGYMAINSAVHNMDPDHQKPNLKRPYYLSQMVVATTASNSFDDLKNFALETPTDYGLSVSLAGPEGQLACIEVSPYDLNSSNGFINRLRKAEPLKGNPESLLIVTNLYKLPGWKQHLGQEAPADTPSHSNERSTNLEAQAEARYSDIEKKTLAKFCDMMEMGLNKEECLGATQYLPGDREDFETPTVTEYSLALRFKPENKEPLKAKVRYAQQNTDEIEAKQTPWHKINFG